jgi:hypothetical protein
MLIVWGLLRSGSLELIGFAHGERASESAWTEILHDLRRRGLRDPGALFGEPDLGLWRAIRGVWPNVFSPPAPAASRSSISPAVSASAVAHYVAVSGSGTQERRRQ